MVDITNESHEHPAAHQYTVSIDDVNEDLIACTCPHHVHRNVFNKQLAGIENAMRDGSLEAFPSEDEDDTEPEDCDCDGLGDFPCWPCVRIGRKELPNEPPLQLFVSMTRQVMFSDILNRRTLTKRIVVSGLQLPVTFHVKACLRTEETHTLLSSSWNPRALTRSGCQSITDILPTNAFDALLLARGVFQLSKKMTSGLKVDVRNTISSPQCERLSGIRWVWSSKSIR